MGLTNTLFPRDALSGHVAVADHSINLGSIDQEGGNPFLNAKKLVRVAIEANADAIHPGYGYLSESATFADAVREAGLIFVGPTSNAMSTLGDKRTAKDYLRTNDPRIPLIPGFAGSSQDIAELQRAAEQIGYPVMLKASAGGGGKGMRIVRRREDLQTELTSAQSEAVRSFGSSDCILEKYIEAGKHIEIQIIGDGHDNVISLHERECSVQRRHQKVIEETPSPWMTPEKRKEMSEAAVRIGKLLRYENAGTVEFVVDAVSGAFYFLEVNTRLQVEHPITEEVTGLDIVSLQLFVASGGSLRDLSILQQVPQTGHAIECRLCAEDPNRDFYPERGTIHLWKPADVAALGIPNVRFETGVQTGADVSIYFDSMIAKVVVWAPSRSLAIHNMVRVLANTACVGVRTNQQFLQNCLLHPGFKDPSYTTSFITQNMQDLLCNPNVQYTAELQQVLSLVPCLFSRNPNIAPSAGAPIRPFRNIRPTFRNQVFDSSNVNADLVTSPLAGPLLCTWTHSQQNGEQQAHAKVSPVSTRSPETINGGEASSIAQRIAEQYSCLSNMLRTNLEGFSSGSRETMAAKFVSIQTDIITSRHNKKWLSSNVTATVDNISVRALVVTDGCQVLNKKGIQKAEPLRIMCHFPLLGDWVDFKVYSVLTYYESLRQTVATKSAGEQRSCIAPMPCKIISVLVNDGEEVKAGQPVLVIESMKMEMNIAVSVAGRLKVAVSVGDAIDEGLEICTVI